MRVDLNAREFNALANRIEELTKCMSDEFYTDVEVIAAQAELSGITATLDALGFDVTMSHSGRVLDIAQR